MIYIDDIIEELERKKEQIENKIKEEMDTIMIYRLTGYLQGIDFALKLVNEADEENEKANIK
jgi:hypothetical protein